MGFGGSKKSQPVEKKEEPTYTPVEQEGGDQERRTTGIRRAERFQTREQPSASILEDTAADDPSGVARTGGRRRGGRPSAGPRRAAMVG